MSGELDRVFSYGKDGREEAIAEAVQLARDEAIRAGADPVHVDVVEIEEVPLAYLTDPVARCGSRRPARCGRTDVQPRYVRRVCAWNPTSSRPAAVHSAQGIVQRHEGIRHMV